MTMLQRLFLFAFLLMTAMAQDESKAIAEFQQACRVPKKGAPAAVEVRQAALRALAGFDSEKAAAALVEGHRNVGAELDDLDGRRQACSEELARILRGQEGSGTRTFPPDVRARHDELRQQMVELRQRADAVRALQLEVGEAIAKLRRKDSLLFLLQKVVGNKKDGLPVRLCAGRAIGGGAADVMEELAMALQRAREPEELLPLLDAMALAGRTAQLHTTPLLGLLQHKEEAVRERAALALAKIAVPEAIEPVIALLARSSGQTQARIAAALEVLTRQQFGLNVGAWQAWWAAEGKAFVAAGPALGGGTPSHRKQTDKNYYFGIPQDQSTGIVYVIDCSDSMKAPVDFKPPTTTSAGGGDGKQTRLDACKQELIRALGLLQPTQKFAILWYNDMPHWWQRKMLPGSKENIEAAQAFVRTLKHASSTNIHDSLEQSFALVGRGVRDKYYGVEVDTIFLLTDGSPTKPTGELDSTEKILTSVRAWNPLRRVTIHTIGIGNGLNEPFLAQLARENGGEFKKF